MDTLSKLAIAISNPNKSDDYKLEQICINTMKLITHCNRVSLWVFSDELDELCCLKSIENNGDDFASGQTLKKVDFPDYFKAILVDDVLIASDARNHSATKCFNEPYFEPRGVICCECVDQQVVWHESETKILRRIANMMSMFFK